MLTLKNICKTYHTKGGVDVKALDDVSLTFPETGMVFILGKSGSGKSTLLNVCGGLDSADSGEIIICGRSSATFSGSDFDSYRNTFVGFIFQEYNILNEFTVEENLALALELQGKNKNKEKVAELLRQVDLSGYARRKPNTLSGGQKQRIAIARALIKDPKIIMADEPTGALDSNTGRQVLDTLKKLSETRLVIVVSHDREFAEIYGDRVIELKDGKVISDVSKQSFAAEKIGENISVIAGDTLSVKNGAELTEQDMRKIRDYIAEADGDIIISRSKNDITSFKKANRIAEDDSSEHFENTDILSIPTREYAAAESALTRSKLPIGKAIKIGASSLKVKKFRLFLTIFLSVIAFIMFGIFSTLMTYNGDNILINSYAQSEYDVIDLKKTYKTTLKGYEDGNVTYSSSSYEITYFTEDDITNLRESLGADVIGILRLSGSSNSAAINVSATDSASQALTITYIKGVGYAPVGSAYRNMLAGTYPAANDEIAISEWYYEMLKAQTFYNVDATEEKPALGEIIEVNSMDDVIGQYLCLSIVNYNSSMFSSSTKYVCYKITGVYDGGDLPSAYAGYNDSEITATWDNATLNSYSNYISESIHNVLLVSDTFCSDFAETYGISSTSSNYDYYKYFNQSNDYFNDEMGIYIYYINVYDPTDENTLDIYWLGEQKAALSDGEIILDADSMSDYLEYSLNYITDTEVSEWKEAYTQKYGALYAEAAALSEYYSALYEQEISSANPDHEKAEEYNNLYYYYYKVADAYNTLTLIDYVPYFARYAADSDFTLYIDADLYVEAVCDYVQNYLTIPLTITLSDYDKNQTTFEIVGFHEATEENYNYYYDGVYLSQANYDLMLSNFYTVVETNYILPEGAIYSYAFVKYDGSHSLMSAIVDKMNTVNADDTSITISGNLYSSVYFINSFIEILRNVFLYAGIALAVFSALLLFNFISISITNKTHEIGVLRAVGARGWDVFKIFFAEAAIITLICFIISLIGTLILVGYLNSVLSAGLGFPYVLFSFGITSFAMMLAVAAIVAILGTFIPVFRISRKKPVDSMRN